MFYSEVIQLFIIYTQEKFAIQLLKNRMCIPAGDLKDLMKSFDKLVLV